MNFQLKKTFTALALPAVMALAVVGCGSTNSAGNAATSTGSNGTSSNAPAQTATGELATIKSHGKLVAGVKYDTNLFGLKNTSTGQVEGFDVDMMKSLAKKIFGDESKVEFKEVTSKTRIPLLQNGDIDIIAATMTITDDRKKQVDFSDIYFAAGQSLLVPKNSPITGIQDLKGKTVIGVKGSTSVINIKKKAPDATLGEYDNYTEAFTALKSGKGDALTTDNAILIGMTKQDPNYKLVGGLFTDEPYGFAFKKGNQDFVDYVNSWLKEIKANGEYKTLYKKWFGSDPQQ